MIPRSFDFTVPEGWSALPPMPGCAAIVAEPEHADHSFRAVVSLVFDDLDGQGVELSDYVRASVESLGETLTDAVLLDEQPTTLAGADAVVSTIGYRQGNDARTLRQWVTVTCGVGALVGAVCSNDRFPGLQATLDEVARSLVLETEP